MTVGWVRYNSRHEITHPVGLRVLGGAPFSDPPVSCQQREGGSFGRPRTAPASAHACYQRSFPGCATLHSRSGDALAHPASQRRRTGQPPGPGGLCPARDSRSGPAPGPPEPDSARRACTPGFVALPSRRTSLDWARAGRRLAQSCSAGAFFPAFQRASQPNHGAYEGSEIRQKGVAPLSFA